ncbi:MAG: hypothetical protein M0P66_09300 [Salinivirgaceae bacterium]|nr:hypothetical protein [Salinivirgaceae bacterium]
MRLKNVLIIACVFTVVLISNSCKKDSENLKSEGLLTWTGEYEVDGCGFFITINEHKYKPENESMIDKSYKSGTISVIVEYQLLDKQIQSACGDLPTPTLTDAIELISIKKK